MSLMQGDVDHEFSRTCWATGASNTELSFDHQASALGWRGWAAALCCRVINRRGHAPRLQRLAYLRQFAESEPPGMDANHEFHRVWTTDPRLCHWAAPGAPLGQRIGLGTHAAGSLRSGADYRRNLCHRSRPGLSSRGANACQPNGARCRQCSRWPVCFHFTAHCHLCHVQALRGRSRVVRLGALLPAHRYHQY